MPGQKGPLQMRQNGVVEAHDAWEAGLTRPQLGQQVFPDLGFDGAMNVAALSQLPEITWLMHGIETTSPARNAAESFASGGDFGS
ncbi:hypothetical protein GCM10022419_069260 [Nonomuraea rosea]|uniref:Uncharacterized protein n=1 Tax=Nonomuraea rosea TaxID=638574 RepID=A0ABP6YBR7_9ACTN